MHQYRRRFLSASLCLMMLLCLCAGFAAPVEAATGYDRGYPAGMAGSGKIVAHGLDVSAWQESGLNFQNFANAGYDYVILRCGTSYGKDRCFEEYYNSARAAGLDVGCYFYSYALNKATAQQEARDVLSWIKGKVFEYPVYFDFEDPTQVNLSYSLSADICRGFMDVMKDNGYLVGLYSMSWILSRDWVTSSGIRGTYEGWVAHVYSDANNTGITSGEFNIFKDRYCSTYGMHQYSFTTYVNGVGPFDANVSYKNYPDLVATYGFNGYDGHGNRFDGCKPLYMGDDFAAYIRNPATGKYLTDVNNNLALADGKFGTSRKSFYSAGTQMFHFIYNKNDGTYSIRNDVKDKWFDVSGGIYKDGTNMQLWEGNGRDTQRFYIYFTRGNFYFRCKDSDKVFDVNLATGNLQLYGNDTGTSEDAKKARAFEILKINMDYGDWYLNFGTDEVVYVRNVASGKLMTTSNLDVSFKDPQYTDNQKWKLKRKVDGSYEFVNVATGKYLDVNGGGIATGTTVDTWDSNGHRAQSFYILPSDTEGYCVIKPCYAENLLDMAADTGNLAIYPPHLEWDVPRAAQLFEIVFEGIQDNTIEPAYLGEKFEAVISSKKNARTLTDLGNGTLQAQEKTGESNQVFQFFYDKATQSYEILGSSGQAVDVASGSYQNESLIRMYRRNDTPAQRYRLYEVEGGYALSPVHTNRLVDIHGENHTTVQLFGLEATDNRTFTLDIQKKEPDQILLNDASSYRRQNRLVKNVDAETTVRSLLSEFVNETLQVLDPTGKEITDTALVGTGAKVNLYRDNVLIDTVSVVVLGDVDGNGVVDTTDYIRIKSVFLDGFKLNEAESCAADVDASGEIDTTDYMRMKSYFLNSYNLYQ